MFILSDISDDFKVLSEKLLALSDSLVSGLTPVSTGEIIPANINILDDKYSKRFIRIKDGCLTYKLREKTIYVFDKGDLIGVEGIRLDHSASISSQFAVVCDFYSYEDLITACSSDQNKFSLLQEYYRARFALLHTLICDVLKSEVPLEPALKRYSEGDFIITQNDTGEEVFTLVEGKAEAFVDGVKVGDIARDEIFGMISAITGTPRSATVLAASRCLALSVPNSKFLELIQNKPQMVLKLLEDMSKLIIDLNKKVVSLKEAGPNANYH